MRLDRCQIGAVIIGRNEGDRLRRCLRATVGLDRHICYVDSGSTDDSVALAKSLGVEVVRLDASAPFTAARARNAGLNALLASLPELRYVQFIDGDCELTPTWVPAATRFLDTNERVAVVFGRLRERHPDASVYNLLCDIEWNVPIGESRACGGVSMMRVCALQEVGWFLPSLIAGEEPELCVRLRKAGWKIWRVDEEMALHDAAMTRFAQWWKRSIRAGYAFAEGANLHGARPERHWAREARSSMLWGFVLPGAIVGACFLFGPTGLLGMVIYPLQMGRLYLREHGAVRPRVLRAVFLVLCKFPEAVGHIKFRMRLLRRHREGLIEYK